jgi:hypothetical protein
MVAGNPLIARKITEQATLRVVDSTHGVSSKDPPPGYLIKSKVERTFSAPC